MYAHHAAEIWGRVNAATDLTASSCLDHTHVIRSSLPGCRTETLSRTHFPSDEGLDKMASKYYTYRSHVTLAFFTEHQQPIAR